MATINDVARAAGVSKKTVSRILNELPTVGEDTRARVHAAMAALAYVPDRHAQALGRRRSPKSRRVEG